MCSHCQDFSSIREVSWWQFGELRCTGICTVVSGLHLGSEVYWGKCTSRRLIGGNGSPSARHPRRRLWCSGGVIPVLLRQSCLPRKGASSVLAARRSWCVLFLSEFRSTKLNYCSTTRRGRDIQRHPVFLYTCLRAFSRSKTEGVFFPPSDALHIGCPQFSSINTMFVK